MPSDCYCAICGSCTDQFQVGTRSEKALRVRSKVLRNRLRPRSEPKEPVSESDDDRSERLYDEEHSYQLSHSYDPQILEGHDTSWITELLLVANDGRKRRAPRTLLCGIATMEPGGFNTCEGTYDGGEEYGAEHYDCEKLPLWRFSDERDSLGNYPCHIPCFKMLVRAITGSEDFRQLDIYPLHRAMVRLARYGGGRCLDVDYGDKSELDQYWESFPGEEFSVINPLEQFLVTGAMIYDFILTEERKNVEESLATKLTRVQNDPFCKLPVELIHHIAYYTEGHELIALRQVSRFVRQATRSSSFWKRMLLGEQAWLWDTPFSLECWEPPGEAAGTQHLVDWEKLYIVMEKSTTRCFGTNGAMMALANRRRIWKVCEQIARVYWKKWPKREELREADRCAERAPIPEDNNCYDGETASDSEDGGEDDDGER